MALWCRGTLHAMLGATVGSWARMTIGINVGFMRPVLGMDEANILVHELGQKQAAEHATGAGSAAAKIAAGNEQQHPPFQPVDLARILQ